MRDIETIDGELRLLARVWGAARHMTGRTPSTAHIDDLLDERAAAAGAKAVVGHVARLNHGGGKTQPGAGRECDSVMCTGHQ
jgi:hypothetical protein